MEHTGWGLNDETVECSNGVQHFTKRNKKWTHWALPRGLYGAEQRDGFACSTDVELQNRPCRSGQAHSEQDRSELVNNAPCHSEQFEPEHFPPPSLSAKIEQTFPGNITGYFFSVNFSPAIPSIYVKGG